MGKLIEVHFDSVLHVATTSIRPCDATQIPDPPTSGALIWLVELVHHPDLDVVIVSWRTNEEGGVSAMRDWLVKNGFPEVLLDRIQFPTCTPNAEVIISAHSIPFIGRFPSVGEIVGFRSWNKPR